jgi:superfamily I DNA/RNA helicase
MKHRLKSLLGQAVVDKIMMGTFHSVAVRCEHVSPNKATCILY